jgi:Acetyltransferase (GNAT) domain
MSSTSVRLYQQLHTTAERSLLYNAPWWLDATCGADGWDAVIHRDASGEVVAAMPYHQTHIRGLSAIITPPLTQWVSVLHGPGDTKEFYSSLMDELPSASILDLSFRQESDFVLNEKAYPVHLRYSYIIPAGIPTDLVRAGYNEGLKRNLRQGKENYVLQESRDIRGFLTLYLATHQQRNMKPPAWLEEVVPRVFEQLHKHECGQLHIALWKGKPIAGILTGWDHEAFYYLAGGRTGDEQGASAHALLLDQAIENSCVAGKAFDFEGSMHPGIANFFQSFGAIPIPYRQLRKFRGLGKLWSLFH